MKQDFLTELEQSAINPILFPIFRYVDQSFPADLQLVATYPAPPADLPPVRKIWGEFIIRENTYTVWEKINKKISHPKTCTEFMIECRGKWLTQNSYINNERIQKWESLPLEKIKENTVKFPYIKDAEIVLANIIRLNKNELFDRLLFNEKCLDKDGNIAPEYLLRYSNLLGGGWLLPLADEQGNPIKDCQVKPNLPISFGEGKKPAKYLSPAGQSSVILIPDIRDKAILDFICNQINDRHQLNIQNTFSNYAQLFNEYKKHIRATTNEGGKKLGAALSIGLLSIGLQGAFNWGEKSNGDNETIKLSKIKKLHPRLEKIFKGAKGIDICFDMDTKPSTQAKVMAQAQKLKLSIHKYCQIAKKDIGIYQWDVNKGKGLDDLLFNGYSLEDTEIIYNSIWGWYKKLRRLSKLDENYNIRYISHMLNTLHTSDEKRVLAIKSRQGTGKTWAVSNRIHAIKSSLEDGQNMFTLAISHRQSLARSLAAQYGIGYRTDTDNQLSENGLALCADSLISKYQGLDVDLLIDTCEKEGKILNLILDEISQVISHINSAKTEIHKYRDQVILNLGKLIAYCVYGGGYIYVMDADLCDLDLFALSQFAGIDSDDFRDFCYVIDNSYNDDIWEVKMYEDQYLPNSDKSIDGADLWFRNLLDHARENEDKDNSFPIMVSTTGQKIESGKGSIVLSTMLEDKLTNPVLRIDSDSLSDMDSMAITFMDYVGRLNDMSSGGDKDNLIREFQKWLNGFSVIICSPSLETGISIIADIKFDSVWGYCGGNNSINSFIQSICRVRFNCPRHLFIKDHGISDPNARGLGVTAREKKLNMSEKNKYIHKILSAAEFEILDHDSLKENANIDLLNIWAKYNELIDVGLLDPRGVIENQLREMGCRITYYDMLSGIPSNEVKSISDEVKMHKKSRRNTIRGLRIGKAKQIQRAYPISEFEYESLKRKRSLTKEDKLAKARYEATDKFGDDLIDSEKGFLLIAGESKYNIFSKLRLEIILRDQGLANSLSAIALRDRTTIYDKMRPARSDMAMVYQYLGIWGLIDCDEELSKDSPAVINFIDRWEKFEKDVTIATNFDLPKDYKKNPMGALSKFLRPLGYKLAVCFKSDADRRYRIVRNFTESINDHDFNPVAGGLGGFIEYINDDQISTVQQQIRDNLRDYVAAKELKISTAPPAVAI